MEITPESKFARLQVLRHTFSRLTEFYQRKGEAIAWAVDCNGVEISPDFLWEKYARDADVVRGHFMFSTETRIDRHKIIALTERVILELQPLVFEKDTASLDDHYRLNAEYAFLFGIQFLTRWNEVYHTEPFYSNSFLEPLQTDRGKIFCQEHVKLLSIKNQSSFPVFWASQLWFLFEQWGLSHMEYATKFLTIQDKIEKSNASKNN